MRRGRKPAGESRTAEIQKKLAEWKQMPEAQRPSLRTLAAEIGTSHQLLSYHLARWEEWRPADGRDVPTLCLDRWIAKTLRESKGRSRRGEVFRRAVRWLQRYAKGGAPWAVELLQEFAKGPNP